MKYPTLIKLLTSILIASMLAGCTIEPIRSDRKDPIPGAPDWVNKGSIIMDTKGGRFFYGVASVPPQGDYALQKSIADDRSMMEVGNILASYLEKVSDRYMTSSRSDDGMTSEENIYRGLENTAKRQINEGITYQINQAIARQFKEEVSAQFKDGVSRKIKEASMREIRQTISNQLDFSRQLEEEITRQIKEGVSRQIRNAALFNMKGARFISSWRDPRTNDIWSISELNLLQVKSVMSGQKDMNEGLKNYFELNADIIFDQIISDRDSINPFLQK